MPIDAVLGEVIDTLRAHEAVVVHAPTGAGKTTALPPALLDAGLAEDAQIWILEPRRVAARAAARHVARLRGRKAGDEVGWHVRFDPRFTAATRLLYMTDGTAVRRVQGDPFLEGVRVVVFDEFHERSLPSDLALAMVRRVQREVRPDLRLVVMSATLDATRVSDFLDGAPVLRSEGRAFPVDVRYDARPDDRYIVERVTDGVRRAMKHTEGDILAFLPGVGEIQGVSERLGRPTGVSVLPLHGRLPAEAQDRALRKGRGRRVVLATNVAETSLTLDGITAVVDSGLARILRHDPGSGLDRLVLEPISKAAADQRAGRAGRQAPGIAWRLWTEREHHARPEHDTPALHRTDLAGPVLQLRAWGETDPAAFPWVEPPPPVALEAADALLGDLGLLRDGHLTPRGQAAAGLPLHPRLAVLLLEATRLGHPRLGAAAAAVLAERDPFRRLHASDPPPPTSDSDVLDRAHAVLGGDPRLRHAARHQLAPIVKRLTRLARATGHGGVSGNVVAGEAVRRGIAAAWGDRIARRRTPGSDRGRMRGGRGVVLTAQSAVRDAELFACVQVDDGPRREALVRIASAVERDWLDVEERVEVRFDPERRQVTARRLHAVGDLILDERPTRLPAGEQVAACLAEAVAEDLSLLPVDAPPYALLRARLTHLARAMPELDAPVPDDAFLRGLLPELCRGARGVDQLTAKRLHDATLAALPWRTRDALGREAPERIQVPSGSRIRLRWDAEGPPVLAVRIQEVFGWRQTPRVLGGRVSVLLHLLAPNQRPAQITDDLASFWENTWPEVRKELRRRYPKHAWPDDPLTAAPEKRPRRRR